MIENISELFDFVDEIVIAEQTNACSSAEIKELTMKKIHQEHKHTKPRSVGRTLLIAAVVAAVLAVGSFAVYQHTMADRVVRIEPKLDSRGKEMAEYSMVGYPEDETADASDEAYTPKYSSNPEYYAMLEWNEYFSDEKAASEDMDERLPADDLLKDCYGVGYKAKAEKLKAIADKYGLRLYHSHETVTSYADFCAAINVPSFIPVAEDWCIVQLFDGGDSFFANAISMENPLAEEALAVQVYRNAKGIMTTNTLGGGAADTYEYEEYVTASGVTAELALGEVYSMIFVELDNCYVACQFGGRQNNGYKLETDMDGLRQLADSIDFSVLDIG